MKIDDLRKHIFETIKIVNVAIEEYRRSSPEHQEFAANLIVSNIHSLARYVKMFQACKSETEKSNLLFFNVKFGKLHL